MSDSMSWCADQEDEARRKRDAKYRASSEYAAMLYIKNEYELLLNESLPYGITIRDIEFLQEKPNPHARNRDVADVEFYTEKRLSRAKSIYHPVNYDF